MLCGLFFVSTPLIQLFDMSSYTPGKPIVNNGILTVTSTWFDNLYETDSGAAIANGYTGVMTVKNTIYTDNSADFYGGAIYNEGTMALSNGALFTGNCAQYGGAVASLDDDASFTVIGGQFTENTAEMGGAIDNSGKLILTDVTFTQNACTNGDGGAILHEYGTATLNNITFADNRASGDGGAIDNWSTMTITNAVFRGNSALGGGAICNESEGILTLSNVSFLTADDTIVNSGTMTWTGTITLAASVSTQTAIKANNVNLVFDISSYTSANSTAFINNYGLLSGLGSIAAVVNDRQTVGTYTLAENASSCNKSLTVTDADGTFIATLALNDTSSREKRSYSFTQSENNTLQLVVDGALWGDENGIAWHSVKNAEYYEVQFSTDNFNSVLALKTDSVGIDTQALPEASYQWRVRDANTAEWTVGNAFSTSEPTKDATILAADNNGDTDVFFATAIGAWDSLFAAQHVGTEYTEATNEVVALNGRNRFANVFMGADDTSILCLTDDLNGDALFFDDIYTTRPKNTEDSGRIINISEIRAGDGDDIIDMTSHTFSQNSHGMTIRGGNGNDVLWAGDGNNMLFGDDGDDRLTGSAENDILVGGSGNDTIICSGGNDIVCFSTNWGTDIVTQKDDGTVTLWFATGSLQNWDSNTLTYSDGDNSVRISGINATQITLKFGDDASDTYAHLAAACAFENTSSSRIFDTAANTIAIVNAN